MLPLYKFQEEGVAFLKNNKSALLADECGVGKTPQFLRAAVELEAARVLIICPASIKWDYIKRCEKWGMNPRLVHIVTPQNAWSFTEHTLGVFVMNYDICHRKEIAKVFSKKRFDVLICDESHYLKNSTTRRTKAVFGAGGYASLSTYRWMVTGTPVLNKPEEIYTTIKTLRPDLIEQYSDYISFTKRYCGGHQGAWGWVADGATNVKELTDKLHGFMLRRELDVQTELPEKIMNVIRIEKTPEIEKIIFEEKKEEGADMSVRQRMGLAKVDEVVAYVNDILDSEKKVVVFAYHHAVIDELVERFEGAVKITGDDSSLSKNRKILDFIEGTGEVLILQIDAAGTGIDGLQDVCRHAVFAEISYVPGVNQQAMGRIHRNGQKHKSIFDFLVVEGSIDENMLDKNLTKSEIIQEIMRDEKKIFDFSKPKTKEQNPKEDFMIDSKVKVVIEFEMQFDGQRLGQITQDLANSEGISGVKTSLSWDVVGGGEVTPVVKEAKEPKKRKVKETAPVVEPTPAVVGPTPAVDEVRPLEPASFPPPIPYKQRIMDAAAKIQKSVGEKDPSKINETLSALSKKIKDKFPKYPHALAITNPSEQNEVLDVVAQFLNEKGIK